MLTISTGVAAASVVFLVTVGAHVTRKAEAGVARRSLHRAGPSIVAGPVGTGHTADLAVFPIESLRARAGVIIHLILRRKSKSQLALTSELLQGQNSSIGSHPAAYVATASVLAWVAVALVGLDIAGFAAEARLADAGVAALTSVCTGGFVHAGLVIGAEVQILVA